VRIPLNRVFAWQIEPKVQAHVIHANQSIPQRPPRKPHKCATALVNLVEPVVLRAGSSGDDAGYATYFYEFTDDGPGGTPDTRIEVPDDVGDNCRLVVWAKLFY
jgi:hypothetical protein